MKGCGRAPYSQANDHKLRCLSILRGLYTEDHMVFWEPVPESFTDYFEMIAEPIDLGSILGMIRKGKIADCTTFSQKARLVWANCKQYNAEGTPLHDLADELSKVFETMFNQMVVSDDKPKDPIQTFDSYGNISGSEEAIKVAMEAMEQEEKEREEKKQKEAAMAVEAAAAEAAAAAPQEAGDVKMELEA